VSVLPDGAFGERAARRLREEYVVWPTVYNRPNAHRLAHVDANPNLRVSGSEARFADDDAVPLAIEIRRVRGN
jgi:hypothetical protein